MYNNLIDILRDMPKGTKLYSPICGECEFRRVNGNEINVVASSSKYGMITYNFDENGCYLEEGECLLFPSKVNRDWSTFELRYPDTYHFKPFDKVIVRIKDTDKWAVDFFSYYTNDRKYPYACSGNRWFCQCFPYNQVTACVVGTERRVMDER